MLRFFRNVVVVAGLSVPAILWPCPVYASVISVLVEPVTDSTSGTAAPNPRNCASAPAPANSTASKLLQITCELERQVNLVAGYTASEALPADLLLRGRIDKNGLLSVNVISRTTDAVIGTAVVSIAVDAKTFSLQQFAPQLLNVPLTNPPVAVSSAPPLRIPGAGYITATRDTIYGGPPKVASDSARLLLIAFDGFDPSSLNLDPQVSYAYNAFRRIYAAHNFLALPIAGPGSVEAVKSFCLGPLGVAPILMISMSKDQRTNSFLDAVYSGVQFDGVVEQCSSDKTALIARDANLTSVYRSVYYRNFFAGVQAGAAYSTSPFITKYKSWLLLPLAFLGTFAHESQSYNGTVYCAAVALANQHLAKIADPTLKDATPNCHIPGRGIAPLNI